MLEGSIRVRVRVLGTLRMRSSLSRRREALEMSSVVMLASWSSSKLLSSIGTAEEAIEEENEEDEGLLSVMVFCRDLGGFGRKSRV